MIGQKETRMERQVSPEQMTKTYQDADAFLRDRPSMEQQGWKVVKEVEQWKPPFNVTVTYQRTNAAAKLSQQARRPLRYPTGSVPESRQPFPSPVEKPPNSMPKPGQAQKPPRSTSPKPTTNIA
jgi:hypothetical protein